MAVFEDVEHRVVDGCRVRVMPDAAPGHWNDPDMLIVGLHGPRAGGAPGATDTEYRALASLWCLLASPLILGADPNVMRAATKATVMNPEMIAVDQDAVGAQAQLVRSDEVP